MIEQSVIETLFGAIEGGRWERIVGALLVALVALARFLTRDRFSATVGEWISAVSALLGGVGAAFLAGAAWWHALIIGVLVLPSSSGFWDQIRSLLPPRPVPVDGQAYSQAYGDDIKTPPETPLPRVSRPQDPGRYTGPITLVALALCGALTSGCGACVAERGVVDALSAGVGAAEGSIGDAGGEGFDQAMEIAQHSVGLGEALVEGCEAVRDSAGWDRWVLVALSAASHIRDLILTARRSTMEAYTEPGDFFEGAPVELDVAIRRLEDEASR